jgi:hypothetical protein
MNIMDVINNIDINIEEIETNIIEKIKHYKCKILDVKNRLLTSKFEFEKNYLNNLLRTSEEQLDNFMRKSEERISYYSCLNLFYQRENTSEKCIEQFKRIIRWGNYNKIYKSCSEKFWTKGIYAGIYIDLLDIMKNPGVLNLPKHQIQKEYLIINNICKLFVEQQITSKNYKYIFLNFLFKMLNYSDILNFILDTVKIINTNTNGIYNSQIGYKKIKNTDIVIYYLKYGLISNVPYNIGMINIDSKFISHNEIKYVAHFMSKIQSNKYVKEQIIPIKDASFILTPVNKINEKYNIHNSAIITQDVFHNYINNSDKLNYENAFIIDIVKLYNHYVENFQYNNIQKNDIGLFLIHKEIPMSCVVEIINGYSIM